MSVPDARSIVERALAEGIVPASVGHEALQRFEARTAAGEDPSIVEILSSLSAVPRHVLEALDDRSLLGRTLGGFRLDEKLGEGSMGGVYRATQLSLDRAVALKVMAPALSLRPDFAERFRREAKAAARLDHPCVVQPIDFGDDAGFLYFAMELMDGGSAAERVKRGALPEAEVLDIAESIGRALAYASSLGLVHRDVKPANILFSKHGDVKLADLGLVMQRSDERRALTEPGLAMGTPEYMAPEQATGERDLDVRTDLYGLGISLFELATGKLPFDGETALQIVTQHLTAPLPDPRSLNPEVSAGLASLLGRMTRKRRRSRLPSAEALLDAVKAVRAANAAPDAPQSPEPATGPEPELKPEPPAPTGAGDAPPAPPTSREAAVAEPAAPDPAPAPRSRRRALGLTLALGALVLLTILGAWLVRRGPGGDPAAERRAIQRLRGVLLARRNAEGAFGETEESPTDAWVSASCLYALTLPADPEHRRILEQLVARIPSFALDGSAAGDPPGFAGYPYLSGPDTVACLEATATVGSALAFAHRRKIPGAEAPARDVLRFLLDRQNPDGSWSTIPALGPKGAMTSATVEGVASLLEIAAALGAEADIAGAVRRGARWLAETFDAKAARFPISPRRSRGARRFLSGLDDEATLALLSARAFARRRKEPTDPRVDDALRLYADHHEPLAEPIDRVVTAPMEDYRFWDLPRRYRTSATEFAWLAWPWRVEVAERIAREADLPRRDAWKAEAARLRARLPELVDKVAEDPATWKMAEVLGIPDLAGP